MILFRIFNLLFPVFNVLYFYFMSMHRERFWFLTGIFFVGNALLFVYVLLFLKPTNKSISNLVLYFLFLLSLVLFFIFIKNDIVNFLVYVFSFVVGFFMLMKIGYELFYKKENYFLNDMDFYCFLFSSFFMMSATFALIVFLDLNRILLSIIIFIFNFIIYFSIYNYHSKLINDTYRYVLVSALISTEVFIGISFLPYSFYVNAILTLIFNLAVASISKDYLLNKISFRKNKSLLIMLSLLILVILLLAKRV